MLNNADKVERSLTNEGKVRYNEKFRNKDNLPSDIVVISKKINGTYYVIVAVPDSKARCFNIISAYIGNKKETAQEFDESLPKPTPEANLESVSTDSVSENGENVNTKKSLDVDSEGNALSDNANPTSNSDIRFSLDVPVEETRELIAVHNMHEDNLIKTLELGGFAMPSIAIMKAKQASANSD